jgi:hypothetical protein
VSIFALFGFVQNIQTKRTIKMTGRDVNKSANFMATTLTHFHSKIKYKQRCPTAANEQQKLVLLMHECMHERAQKAKKKKMKTE